MLEMLELMLEKCRHLAIGIDFGVTRVKMGGG